MEKTIFLFRRHPDRTLEDFHRYYVHNHAPLGARLTRVLQGYVVNLADAPGAPDAVTEHWLDAAMDILTPEKAYDTPEEFQQVLDDDRTLFSGFDLHVVVGEDDHGPGEALSTAPGALTPETKLLWLYPKGAEVPSPAPGARRTVDNRVGYKLVPGATGMVRAPSELGVIRMAWGADPGALGEAAAGAIPLREHVFIAPPPWPDRGGVRGAASP